MNKPKQPQLPEAAQVPPPERPHPMDRPDERKEGGPDFGKEGLQREKKRRDRADAAEEAETGRPPTADRD